METEVLQSEAEHFNQWAENNYHTKNELVIIESAILAYKNNDRSFLDILEAFGPTARHRVMNLHSYQKGLIFGWTNTELSEHNWLNGHKFEIETIVFKTKIDGDKNTVEIGRGPNGKYTTGHHFNYGNGGSYSSCSIYGRVFENKSEAMDSAINYAKQFYTKELNGNNFDNNKELIKQVLTSISQYQKNSKQTTLF